jgi:hypothetical protein
MENIAAVRQEMLDLLGLQMEALDSPQGLNDIQLRECYLRQNRVQELREILQAASSAEDGNHPTSSATQSAVLTNAA